MRMKPAHPGELFHTEVMIPENISVENAAKQMDIAPFYLHEMLLGNCPIDRKAAQGMAKMTNTSFESWYNIQKNLDAWEDEYSLQDMHHEKLMQG